MLASKTSRFYAWKTRKILLNKKTTRMNFFMSDPDVHDSGNFLSLSNCLLNKKSIVATLLIFFLKLEMILSCIRAE